MQRKYSEVVNFIPNFQPPQNRHNSRQPINNQKLSPVEQVRPSFSPTVYNNPQYQTFLSPSQVPNQAMQGRNASFQVGERRSLPSYNPKIEGGQQMQSPVFDPRGQNNNGFRNSGFSDQPSGPRRMTGHNLSTQPIQNYNSPQNIAKVRQFDAHQLPDNLARNLQTTHTSPVKLEAPQRFNQQIQNLNVVIPRYQPSSNQSNTINSRQNGRFCQSMIIQQTGNDQKLLNNNSGLSASNPSNGNQSSSDLQSTFSSDNYSSYVDLNSPIFSQQGSRPKKLEINPRHRKNDDVWKSAEITLFKNANNSSNTNLVSNPTSLLDTIKQKQQLFMKEIKKNIQSLKIQQKQKKISFMQTKAQTPTQNQIPTEFKFRKKNDMGFSQAVDFSSITAKSKQPTPRNFSMDDFEQIQKLGRGTFGEVFLVRERKSRFICVIKTLSKKKIKQMNLQEHVFRQIKIQSYLVHKHLTALYGVFHDESKVYLILQCMPDGSMASNGKKKITQSETAHLINQVCDGLLYMHRQDIIHRDIKPQNLLLNSNYLKIGDFGCAVFGNTLRRTVVGCYAYISPQQFSNNPYDQKIDSWCVGILAYQLLTGKPPYEQKLKEMAIQAKKQNGGKKEGMRMVEFPQITFPKDVKVSAEAFDFIKRLLDNDPSTRADIRQALKHKFLQKAKQYEKYLQSKL